MKVLVISLLILIGVVLTILADILLKKGGYSDWRYLIGGFLIYGVIALPVAAAFKYTDFGQLFLIWEDVAVVLGVATASWYYAAAFTGYRFSALALALAALWFSYK